MNAEQMAEEMYPESATTYGYQAVREAFENGWRAALTTPQEVTGSTSDGYHTFDELYEYRMLYNAHAAHGWLAAGIPVVKSWKHSDGEPCFGGGWFIVTAKLPAGQVSNHYKAEHWGLFQVPEVDLPPTYDGHTPQVAAERLYADAAHAPASQEGDAREQIARALCEGADTVWDDLSEQERVWHYRDAESILAAFPVLSRTTSPDAATEAKQPGGWSTEDRQESKQEAERRWSRPVMREAEQRYQAGSINGFMLGAEWQKARETFISYKVIADEARAERDAALAAIERVRAMVEEMGEAVGFDRLAHGQEAEYPVSYLRDKIEEALDGAPEPEWEPCTAETPSWDHYRPEQIDSYMIRCTELGKHDEHRDSHTGLTWRAALPVGGESR